MNIRESPCASMGEGRNQVRMYTATTGPQHNASNSKKINVNNSRLTWVLFSFKKISNFGIVAFSFVYDKYCLIIN